MAAVQYLQPSPFISSIAMVFFLSFYATIIPFGKRIVNLISCFFPDSAYRLPNIHRMF